jgi:hypothetical protein
MTCIIQLITNSLFHTAKLPPPHGTHNHYNEAFLPVFIIILWDFGQKSPPDALFLADID